MSGTSSAEPQALARYSTRALALDADLLAGSAQLAGVLAVFESLCRESSFRVHVSHLPGKVTGHSGRAQPLDAWVGIVGSGFRLADSGALQHIFGWLPWYPYLPGFPGYGPGRSPRLGRFPYFWRPWPGQLPIITFLPRPFQGAIISLLPWLSPKEESPSILLPPPPTKPSFGDLIEPTPAMPNPGQTANGRNPSVNEQTKLGKLIPQTPEEIKQEILDSIKKRMDRLPNDKKEQCVEWVQDRIKNMTGTEISGVGAYDEDWSASNYRYMFEGGEQITQSNVDEMLSHTAPGAILVWTKEQADNNNGHVAAVERVTSEGIWISEANWDANNDGVKTASDGVRFISKEKLQQIGLFVIPVGASPVTPQRYQEKKAQG